MDFQIIVIVFSLTNITLFVIATALICLACFIIAKRKRNLCAFLSSSAGNKTNSQEEVKTDYYYINEIDIEVPIAKAIMSSNAPEFIYENCQNDEYLEIIETDEVVYI